MKFSPAPLKWSFNTSFTLPNLHKMFIADLIKPWGTMVASTRKPAEKRDHPRCVGGDFADWGSFLFEKPNPLGSGLFLLILSCPVLWKKCFSNRLVTGVEVKLITIPISAFSIRWFFLFHVFFCFARLGEVRESFVRYGGEPEKQLIPLPITPVEKMGLASGDIWGILLKSGQMTWKFKFRSYLQSKKYKPQSHYDVLWQIHQISLDPRPFRNYSPLYHPISTFLSIMMDRA